VFFGLPADTVLKFPHSPTIVGKDVLETLFPILDEIHPNIAKEIEAKKQRDAEAQEIRRRWDEYTPKRVVQQDEQSIVSKKKQRPVIEEEPGKKRKRKQQVTSIADETTLDPEVEAKVSVAHPVRLIAYSEDQIRTFTDGQRLQDSDLKAIMKEIEKFALGGKNYQTVHRREYGVKGAILRRLRKDRWRIELEHQGNNVFTLVQVGDRKHFYEN